jgi:hypothetical protein
VDWCERDGKWHEGSSSFVNKWQCDMILALLIKESFLINVITRWNKKEIHFASQPWMKFHFSLFLCAFFLITWHGSGYLLRTNNEERDIHSHIVLYYCSNPYFILLEHNHNSHDLFRVIYLLYIFFMRSWI